MEGPSCAAMCALCVDDGEPSWCHWRDVRAGRGQSGYNIYIGGLTPGTDDEDVRQWISRPVSAARFHLQRGRLASERQPIAGPRVRHSLPGEPHIVDMHVARVRSVAGIRPS